MKNTFRVSNRILIKRIRMNEIGYNMMYKLIY